MQSLPSSMSGMCVPLGGVQILVPQRVRAQSPQIHLVSGTLAVLLAVLGSMALAAQDKYTLKIPDGLSWSEFRGYETWQDVAVSQTETSLKVLAANDAMMNAYRDGVPGNGSFSPTALRLRRSSAPSKGTLCLPIS
jgi:hypothetical protein